MDQPTEASQRRALWPWAGVLLAGCALTLSLFFGSIWKLGWTTTVPSPDLGFHEELGLDPTVLLDSDHHFAVWLMARNARALIHHPWAIFDAEQCYPAENSLAYGEHGISLGLLAIPGYLISGDPILTYNLGLITLTLLSALAMFWLVAAWTREPAAGVVAGLLFAFAATRMTDLIHIYAWDTLWTVLALFFAERAFSAGRTRDILAAGAACSVQLATSLYPVIGTVLLALPVLAWLIVRDRLTHLRLAPCLAAGAMILGAAAFVFGPYLGGSPDESAFTARTFQYFLPWIELTPGQPAFPGWVGLALAIVAFCLPRTRVLAGISGEPRWALAAGGLLVLAVASGGNVMARTLNPELFALPNLYAWIAVVVPGLDMVRAPAAVRSGLELLLPLLAGIGAAGLISLTQGRNRQVLAAALVALALLAVNLPDRINGTRAVEFRALELAPPPELLDLFRTLESEGNAGPILELPVHGAHYAYLFGIIPPRLLASAYHHRPVPACLNSFPPPVSKEIEVLGKKAMDLESLDEVRKLGFTTVIIHHPPPFGAKRPLNRRYLSLTQGRKAPFELLATNERASAYGFRSGAFSGPPKSGKKRGRRTGAKSEGEASTPAPQEAGSPRGPSTRGPGAN